MRGRETGSKGVCRRNKQAVVANIVKEVGGVVGMSLAQPIFSCEWVQVGGLA